MLSIHALAHVLAGEPASTSPGHALRRHTRTVMNKKTGVEPPSELKPDTLLTTGGRDPFAQHG